MANQSFHLDPSQLQIAARLQHLAGAINRDQPVTQGLYIHGPVGRGKTMLMDQFFAQLRTEYKHRLHYHHFMAAIHQAMQAYKGQDNPLARVATEWAMRYRVLCVDEFMVEDIGDAMILATLWRHLFALEVVLVTTSNTPPQALYRNGLQRQRFLPAIDLLCNHCDVVYLDGGQDYRRRNSAQAMPYYWVEDESSESDPLANYLQTADSSSASSAPLEVMGRTMMPRWHHQTLAVFDFEKLCVGPRSQRDYMALAARFEAIAVFGVPQFSYVAETAILHGVEDNYQREPQNLHVSKLDNEARRFIALVDECYDCGCLLMIQAASLPHQLYQAQQLATPFERCASRLFEMQQWPLPDLAGY